VLPAIRRRAARLPPLLSLVVVATFKSGDVRFGSKADLASIKQDVRFTPKSGHCGMRTRNFAEKGEGRAFDGGSTVGYY
jgi:hypothetical protein